MIIEGIPIFLYDEGGVAFIIQSLGWVEPGSLRFSPVGSRTAVTTTIQVALPSTISAVATENLVGAVVLLRLWVTQELQGSPPPLRQPSPIPKVGDMRPGGVCVGFSNSNHRSACRADSGRCLGRDHVMPEDAGWLASISFSGSRFGVGVRASDP